MININSILIEGFGSIKDELYFQFNEGIHIIRGQNGAGKTTLFNALYWCLYNENLKEVNQDKVSTKDSYRDASFRGTRVIVSITKDDATYDICRVHNFKGITSDLKLSSGLLVWKDNELVAKQHTADYQSYVDEILEINSQLFLNSVLFGQNMKRFIDTSPADKRNIFESIFDFDWIDKANKSSETKLNEYKVKESELLAKVNANNLKIANINERIEIAKVNAENFEKDINSRVDKLKVANSEIHDKIKSTIEPVKPNIEKQTENTTVDIKISSVEREIYKRNSIINAVSNIVKPRTECHVCGNTLSDLVQIDLMNKFEKDVLEESANKAKAHVELVELNEQLEALMQVRKLNSTIRDNNKRIVEYENSVSLYNSTILNLHNKIADNENLIKSLLEMKPPVEDLDALNLEIMELEMDNEIYADEFVEIESNIDIWSWFKNTCFTQKGIKSYMLNVALAKLNDAIMKYSQRLGFRVSFWIDTEKASKPFMTECSTGNQSFSYKEYSGGEKSKVDVAALFAMHDLVSYKSNINLLLLDEIFEGLDKSAIEDVFDLIRLKAENRSLYIITHRDDIDSLNTVTINVAKINNSTTIL